MKKKYHTKEKVTPKVWMLFDGRYRTDEDRAVCYESCDTLKEAYNNVDDYGGDTVIVEFEVDGNTIKNGKILN